MTKVRIGFDRSENAINRAHERSEQWVERFVRAADDFSTGIEQAILDVRDVIGAVSDCRFKELGERLEELKQRHEQGLLVSVEFLKSLLDLARDVVAAENAAEPLAT